MSSCLQQISKLRAFQEVVHFNNDWLDNDTCESVKGFSQEIWSAFDFALHILKLTCCGSIIRHSLRTWTMTTTKRIIRIEFSITLLRFELGSLIENDRPSEFESVARKVGFSERDVLHCRLKWAEFQSMQMNYYLRFDT